MTTTKASELHARAIAFATEQVVAYLQNGHKDSTFYACHDWQLYGTGSSLPAEWSHEAFIDRLNRGETVRIPFQATMVQPIPYVNVDTGLLGGRGKGWQVSKFTQAVHFSYTHCIEDNEKVTKWLVSVPPMERGLQLWGVGCFKWKQEAQHIAKVIAHAPWTRY